MALRLMPDADSTTGRATPLWRRRLPSPGCLLAVALLLSLTAVCVQQLWRATERRDCIYELNRLGGRVETEPARPVWLHDVIAARLGDETAAGFKEVALVDLSWTRTDDTDLEHLAGCHRLQQLTLDHTPITDGGLAKLRSLTGLRTLSLIGTPITDDGLRHLSGLHNLRELSLNRTPITDAGLRHLRALGNLQSLSLRNTRITDAGLTHLRHLTSLQDVSVGNDISVAVFVDLSPLTRITDAGLVELEGSTRLRTLELANTQVTNSGIRRLQTCLPLCRIDSSL